MEGFPETAARGLPSGDEGLLCECDEKVQYIMKELYVPFAPFGAEEYL